MLSSGSIICLRKVAWAKAYGFLWDAQGQYSDIQKLNPSGFRSPRGSRDLLEADNERPSYYAPRIRPDILNAQCNSLSQF